MADQVIGGWTILGGPPDDLHGWQILGENPLGTPPGVPAPPLPPGLRPAPAPETSWIGRAGQAVNRTVDGMNPLGAGGERVANDAAALTRPEEGFDAKAGHVADIGNAAMNMAAPFIPYQIAAAPARTVGALAKGAVGMYGAKKAAEMAGAGPGVSELAGVAGGVATGLPDMLRGPGNQGNPEIPVNPESVPVPEQGALPAPETAPPPIEMNQGPGPGEYSPRPQIPLPPPEPQPLAVPMQRVKAHGGPDAPEISVPMQTTRRPGSLTVDPVKVANPAPPPEPEPPPPAPEPEPPPPPDHAPEPVQDAAPPVTETNAPVTETNVPNSDTVAPTPATPESIPETPVPQEDPPNEPITAAVDRGADNSELNQPGPAQAEPKPEGDAGGEAKAPDEVAPNADDDGAEHPGQQEELAAKDPFDEVPDDSIPQKSSEAGSAPAELLTLGIPNWVKEDVIPAAKTTIKAVADTADSIRKVFSPVGRGGEGARQAAGILRETFADLAQRDDRVRAALDEGKASLAKLPVEAQHDFVDRIEAGVQQPTSDLQGIAQATRDILKDREDQLRATGKLGTFYDTYFPRLLKMPGEPEMASFGKSPLAGKKSFLKQRTFETFKEAREAGYEPVFDNPIETLYAKVHEMDKFLTAHNAGQELKDAGLLTFVKPSNISKARKAGLEQINDPIATVYGPRSENGATQIHGYMMAPEPIATVINNHLDPGLRNHAGFRALMGLSNSLNQFQLGFSAFHLGFTTLDSMVSKMALGVYQTAKGNPFEGIKSMAQTATAPFTTMIEGSKMLKGWTEDGAAGTEIGKLVDAMKAGGGRAKMDKTYATTYTDGVIKAFNNFNLPGAALRLPAALAEQTARPILEYAVPRMKMGIFADLARTELERLGPGASHDQVRGAMARAWDSVDNRMGQMVYDNLFWNKTAKDLAMLSVRSVGWNLGTLRELGGAGKDTVAMAAGKGDFTPRMSYAMALPVVVGSMGAMMQYLLTSHYTGKPIAPDGPRDYFFPRTGLRDKYGNDQRVSLPSYVKDIYHYSKDPVGTVAGKFNPWISSTLEMLRNQDYYGNEIRNSDDPIVKQALDTLKYAAKTPIPFAVRGMQQLQQGKKDALSIAMPFVGITPAPKALSGEEDKFEHAKAIEKRVAKESSDHKSFLRDTITSIKDKPPEEVYKTLSDLASQGKLKKEDIPAMAKMQADLDKGVTPFIRHMRTQSPEVRARYILNELKSVPRDQWMEPLSKFAEAGILNKSVLLKMSQHEQPTK